MFSVLEIIAFESFAVISTIYEEKTCALQSTCYETVLRFLIWLMQMFSYSIYPRFMENWDESVLVQIPGVFETREHVYWQRLF